MIEDSAVYARLITGQLSGAAEANFQVEVAGSLADGLDRMDHGHFDIVIADLMLPDSDGLNTFYRVRNHVSAISIIILSSTSDINVAAKSVEKGAQSCLVKSQVDGQQLVRSLRSAVQRTKAEQADWDVTVHSWGGVTGRAGRRSGPGRRW